MREEPNHGENRLFPADILLPHDCGLTKWAVVACDQYTSQPEYWERVDQYVGTPLHPAPDPAGKQVGE